MRMIAGANGDPSYYGYPSLLTGWNFIVQIGFNPDSLRSAGWRSFRSFDERGC
jgi:hypothetical protein